ncbi:hypothetical protein ACFQ0O_29335 [Saccharopolyspora spinosporotrichia]
MLVGATACGSPVLERRSGLEATLPVQEDVPGYLHVNREAVTGNALRDQRQSDQAEEDGWTCEGLLGRGTAAFADWTYHRARPSRCPRAGSW